MSIPITVMLFENPIFPVEDFSCQTSHSSGNVNRDVVIGDSSECDGSGIEWESSGC